MAAENISLLWYQIEWKVGNQTAVDNTYLCFKYINLGNNLKWYNQSHQTVNFVKDVHIFKLTRSSTGSSVANKLIIYCLKCVLFVFSNQISTCLSQNYIYTNTGIYILTIYKDIYTNTGIYILTIYKDIYTNTGTSTVNTVRDEHHTRNTDITSQSTVEISQRVLFSFLFTK